MAAADATMFKLDDQILKEDVKDINVDNSNATVEGSGDAEHQGKSNAASNTEETENEEDHDERKEGRDDQQLDEDDDKGTTDTPASSCDHMPHGGDTNAFCMIDDDDMKELKEKKAELEELISNHGRSGHIHGESKKGIRGVVNNLRLECGKKGRSTLLSFYQLWKSHLLKK